MKLVYAIVHDEDQNNVISALNEKGFSVTKLFSTGGFLRAGNTTIIVGVVDEKVDEVIDIIKHNSKSRKKVMDTAMSPGSGLNGVMLSFPLEVTVGGATIFVLDVERYEKI
ncbi:MAG TPA: hypothetical protein DDZ89_05055 [Clostridiales bacterium]|nr:hypothetical protein [Clostridiales bacterium]